MQTAPAAPAARRWVLAADPDPAAVDRLARALRLPPVLCRLLVQREHATPEAARDFLRPHEGQIHPPETMAGMADAVERLARAVRGGEKVLVHGDYDVDGICSTAILTRALRMMGGRPVPFVPHRMEDGYDLSDAGVEAAEKAGATLILTCDCGIVAHDAVRQAALAGIDVVVTDHHTPGDALPPAAAVVNPNRRDCAYPDKGLAGAGVAWKLCCALAAELGFPVERLRALLDLVAVATVADIAPLAGENRALVRWGLRILPNTPNAGLRALLATSGLAGRDELSAGQVGFVLAPRLNAVGRMAEAARGVALLLTDDDDEALRIARTLEEENRWRRTVEARAFREAMDALERVYDPDRDRGVVLASEGWHPGVIGIVASRVVERIHRPTVLIALPPGEDGKGSARSVPGFHLYEAMRACAGHLERYGGHRAAAGCSIRPERVDAFRADFDAHARARLDDDMLVPEVRIDLELPLGEADLPLARLLRHAGPFGAGNPTPTFAVRGARLEGTRVVGEHHLKASLVGADGGSVDAIGFRMAERRAEAAGGPVDVAFRVEENRWNGRTTVQARLVDFRPAT